MAPHQNKPFIVKYSFQRFNDTLLCDVFLIEWIADSSFRSHSSIVDLITKKWQGNHGNASVNAFFKRIQPGMRYKRRNTAVILKNSSVNYVV